MLPTGSVNRGEGLLPFYGERLIRVAGGSACSELSCLVMLRDNGERRYSGNAMQEVGYLHS
jgi:hypothetical protein